MRFATFGLIALLFTAPTFAQDTSPEREAAERLVELFQLDKTFDTMMTQVTQGSLQMIDSMEGDAATKAQAKAGMQESFDVVFEEFTWERVKPLFTDIYAEVFTTEELEGLIAFYESPIGQKFIAKQPELAAASMRHMQGLMQEMMPKIQEKVKEEMEKAKAEGDTSS
jgi:hypothetical protein